MRTLVVALATLAVGITVGEAKLSLPAIFADGMVLQRSTLAVVWLCKCRRARQRDGQWFGYAYDQGGPDGRPLDARASGSSL